MQKPGGSIAQAPHTRRCHSLFNKIRAADLSRSKLISCARFPPPFSTDKCQPLHRVFVPRPRYFHSSCNLWPGSNAWVGEFVLASEYSGRDGEGDLSNNDESPRSLDSSSIPGQKFKRLKKREGEQPSSGERNPRTENGISVSSDSPVQWSAVKKKAGKNKIHWVCESCGESFGQWWGSCRYCGGANTLKQFVDTDRANNKARGSDVSEKIARSWLPQQPGSMRPQRLTEVNKGLSQIEWRIHLSGFFGAEVSRVLGGGLVPGSLILVGGDPGVGKSTLLLQIAAILAEGNKADEPAPVIYVSGEESVEQIGNRANRMRIGTDELLLYASTDIEDILEKTLALSPRALIVDSIQTVYLKELLGSAGSVAQECLLDMRALDTGHSANMGTMPSLRHAFLGVRGERVHLSLVALCKTNQNTYTFDWACDKNWRYSRSPCIGAYCGCCFVYGSRCLTNLYAGESYSSHRLLRCVKNRFGSTDELGVFEMSEYGLQAASNPSEIFLSENYSSLEVLAGLAIAVVIDGSRTFLIEIQALCSSSPTVTRHYNGVAANRADMIISVLSKQAGLKLQDNAIFLNVISGFKLTETAGDLAIAAAICSSFLEIPIPNDVAFIGEVGLGGELRMVPRLDRRINAISKLGYKKCVIPKAAENSLKALKLEGLEAIGCRNLKDVINKVFVS